MQILEFFIQLSNVSALLALALVVGAFFYFPFFIGLRLYRKIKPPRSTITPTGIVFYTGIVLTLLFCLAQSTLAPHSVLGEFVDTRHGQIAVSLAFILLSTGLRIVLENRGYCFER